MRRADRLFDVIQVLRTARKPVTAATLAGELEVTVRTIYRDGFVCTAYEKSSLYDGSEGELYDLRNDPRQWRNLWTEPQHRRRRDEMVADLHASLPPARSPRLEAVAAV